MTGFRRHAGEGSRSPWENCFRERKMGKLRMAFCSAAVLLSAIPTVLAQNPANEHNCPAQTGAGGGLEAEPPYVGSGHDGFSRNQSLCLPQLAPVGTSARPLSFVVQGVEPGIRVDSQGTISIDSIRGVSGGGYSWVWVPRVGSIIYAGSNT